MNDSTDVHSKVPRPYRFVEFPRMLHAPDGRTKLVQNTEEKEEAIRKGWQLQPTVRQPEPEPDPIDMETVTVEAGKRSKK